MRGVGAVFLLVATLLVTSPPADAALGLRYRTRSQAIGAQRRGTLRVMCPSRSKVVGGGVTVTGGNTFTRVASNGPIDGGDRNRTPDDGWEGSIANRTPDARRMTTFAICATTGRYRYINSTQKTMPNTFGQETALCPAGMVIVGGGGVVRGAGVKTHRYEDRPTAAPDGWRVSVRNDSAKALTLRTTAICSGTGTYTVYDQTVALAAESYAQPVTVFCPAGSYVTAGGGLASGTTMHSSQPEDSVALDADTKPDNDWVVRFGSPGGTADAFVVCKS